MRQAHTPSEKHIVAHMQRHLKGTHEEHLTKAIVLCILAETDEDAKKAELLASDISTLVSKRGVERCKKAALWLLYPEARNGRTQ